MVKQVVFEESHSGYLKESASEASCTAGLILGHITSNKDYVASFIRCPLQTDGENVKHWKRVKDVEASWVAGHSAQLISCLPGGINIIGVFLIAASEEAKQVSEKLRHLVYQVYRLVSKTLEEIGNQTLDSDECLYWTVIHVDSKNGSIISCRQFDVKDNKDIGRPTEMKQVDVPMQWDCCQTILSIDHVDPAPLKTNSSEIFKSALKPFQNKVRNAHVTIEQKQRLEADILNPSSSATKGTKKKKAQAKSQSLSAKTFQCQLFIPTSMQIKNPDLCHNVQLSGNISSKAYLPPNSTVGDAIKALKEDIIRSVHQRCEILSEDPIDLTAREQCAEIPFPRRVYANNNQNSTILYSDYILPEELLEDCLERFRDNLDMALEASALDVENSSEKFKIEQEYGDSDFQNDTNDNDMEVAHEGASRTNAIIALVATGVAFLGWAFSGLIINET